MHMSNRQLGKQNEKGVEQPHTQNDSFQNDLTPNGRCNLGCRNEDGATTLDTEGKQENCLYKGRKYVFIL